MATLNFPDPVNFQAGASGLLLSPAAGSVTNATIAADAAIATSKMLHRHVARFVQDGTAATVTVPIFFARTAATLVDLSAGTKVAATGNSTVTFDLQKGGVSVLTGVLTLNSSSVAMTPQAASIGSNAAVAGNWFDLVITATVGSGTLPTDLLVQLTYDESPA